MNAAIRPAVALKALSALGALALLSGCARAADAPSPAMTTPVSPTASTASSTASAAAPTTAPARTQTWTALQPGDCLAEPPPADPAVVTVTVVDCTGPHLAEIFLRVGIPVDSALSGTASSQCEAGFLAYTGRSSAGSGYTISYLIDSDQDRTSNNPLPSTVICLLQSTAGTAVNGSARA